MSRRKEKQGNSGSGIALVAGAIGVGLGLLGGYIFNKLKSDSPKAQKAVVGGHMQPQSNQAPQVTMSANNTARDQHFQQTMLCPISLEIMQDPVTIPECGHSFDKSTITPILNKKSQCPLCRKQTEVGRLVPNYQLKNVIQHYKQTRK